MTDRELQRARVDAEQRSRTDRRVDPFGDASWDGLCDAREIDIELGRRYNRMKRTAAEAGAIGGLSGGQTVHRLPKTAETIATKHGVTERTIRRDGKRPQLVESNIPTDAAPGGSRTN